MLKIRGAQIDALTTTQLDGAREIIVAIIWRRREEFAGRVEFDYVEGMVAFAIDQCRRLGRNQLATWIAFAESLFKDDIHPMSASRREIKTETILDELAAQSLFATLKALEATSAAGGATQPTSGR